MSTFSTTIATADLLRAYQHCRAVARREAKNFYFAFLALPPHKRDAMCAMYAFMRRADDIADDEAIPVSDRRALMVRWADAFHSGQHISDDDEAVFTAVRDTQRRFGVNDDLLDELVAGTAMDLQEELPEGVRRITVSGRAFDVYTSIEALDRYCYLVASVVGLVTVRIFGSHGGGSHVWDSQGEGLKVDGRVGGHMDEHAVAMGKAFQYTNILRDVREDAERGRIYLPLDLLTQHGATVEDVIDAASQQRPGAPLLAAMQALASRAEAFYGSERPLIAALEPDSRGAMRTLIDIYHALLHRIEHVHLQVFRERVRVSTPRKLGFLLRGILLRSNA